MTTTVIYVAFRTPSLDTTWLPDDTELVVVHNDRSLDPTAVTHQGTIHVFSDSNVGFGRAINAGVTNASGERIVLVNPDAALVPEHFAALAAARPDEVVSIPLVEDDGRTNANAAGYPTPVSLALTAFRAGRLIDPRGRIGRLVHPLLGRWGRQYRASLEAVGGRWPLRERWITGAALSVDRQRFLAVDGFDERYSLYLEDVDLCRRLASRFPDMEAVVADVPPAIHRSGASSRDAAARNTADRWYAYGARTYAADRAGLAWRLSRLAISLRCRIVDSRRPR